MEIIHTLSKWLLGEWENKPKCLTPIKVIEFFYQGIINSLRRPKHHWGFFRPDSEQMTEEAFWEYDSDSNISIFEWDIEAKDSEENRPNAKEYHLPMMVIDVLRTVSDE
jgi:hypothetical protein